MRTLDTETATVDLAAGAAVLTYTLADAASSVMLMVEVGDGVDDLAAAAETTLTIAATVDGVPIGGEDVTETVQIGRTQLVVPIDLLPLPPGELVITITSNRAADTAVAVTATLWDVSPIQPTTRGRQIDTNASGHVARVTLCDTTTVNTDMLTVGAIADAVWDEATAGHTTAGSFGASVIVIGVAYTHTNGALSESVTITRT